MLVLYKSGVHKFQVPGRCGDCILCTGTLHMWVLSNKGGLGIEWHIGCLVYADDVNILDGGIHTLKKNTEAIVVASKEIGLEVNADKTKYMVMSQDQISG